MKTSNEFDFKSEGIDYLKLCLDVTVYWVGSAYDHVDGILDFYEKSMEVLRDHVTQFTTDSMSAPRRVKKDTFELLPFWLKNPKARREILMLTLDNASTPDSASDHAMIFRAVKSDNAGAIRLVLPIDFIAESTTPFIELAKNLVASFDFSSGHAGYSVNYNDNGELLENAEDEFYRLSTRYPGIDLPDIFGSISVIGNGIKRINWLTLLGTLYSDGLGGANKLRRVLGKDITVHDLPMGVMIQAGPKPEVGDVNRRQRLPKYHIVGRTLASIRAGDHPSFIRDEEETQEWLAYFDT
jgi:hypothetical protein